MRKFSNIFFNKRFVFQKPPEDLDIEGAKRSDQPKPIPEKPKAPEKSELPAKTKPLAEEEAKKLATPKPQEELDLAKFKTLKEATSALKDKKLPTEKLLQLTEKRLKEAATQKTILKQEASIRINPKTTSVETALTDFADQFEGNAADKLSSGVIIFLALIEATAKNPDTVAKIFKLFSTPSQDIKEIYIHYNKGQLTITAENNEGNKVILFGGELLNEEKLGKLSKTFAGIEKLQKEYPQIFQQMMKGKEKPAKPQDQTLKVATEKEGLETLKKAEDICKNGEILNKSAKITAKNSTVKDALNQLIEKIDPDKAAQKALNVLFTFGVLAVMEKAGEKTGDVKKAAEVMEQFKLLSSDEKFQEVTINYDKGKLQLSITDKTGKKTDIVNEETLNKEILKKIQTALESVTQLKSMFEKPLFAKSALPPAKQAGNVAPEKENSQPAGQLHKNYLEKIDKIPKETVTEDLRTLKSASIEDIRYNSRLLNKIDPKTPKETDLQQATNLKDETLRRIKCYTKTYDGKWWTLDYEHMGSNKGRSHEMYIGLGDVLTDCDIKNVLVNRGGKLIPAHRDVVKRGKHKGRIGFVDSKGDYVYTHTNDQFRILDKVETDFKNTDALASYSKTQHYEDQVRASGQERFKYEEKALTLYNETSSARSFVELDGNKSVADQITRDKFQYMLTNGKITSAKLNKNQIDAAKIIEKGFRAKLEGVLQKRFPEKSKDVIKKAIDSIIAAAIINAFHESGLNPESDGNVVKPGRKPEDSVGLFQLNAHGRGDGMTIEARKNPETNVDHMLENYVLSHGRIGGDRLIEAAIRGASVAELAAIFCQDGERPAYSEDRMRERAFTANHMFPTKQIETADSKDRIIGTFENEYHQKGRFNYTGRGPKKQEKLAVGSSTVYGLPTSENCGTFATIGANQNSFLKDIQKYFVPQMEAKNMPWPKTVIIVGLAVNGLVSDGSTHKSAQKSAKDVRDGYLEIAKIFKAHDCEVKITTAPPYQPKLAAVKAFNELLRTENPDLCLDTAKDMTTADGNDWKPGMVGKDNLHLAKAGQEVLKKGIDKV